MFFSVCVCVCVCISLPPPPPPLPPPPPPPPGPGLNLSASRFELEMMSFVASKTCFFFKRKKRKRKSKRGLEVSGGQQERAQKHRGENAKNEERARVGKKRGCGGRRKKDKMPVRLRRKDRPLDPREWTSERNSLYLHVSEGLIEFEKASSRKLCAAPVNQKWVNSSRTLSCSIMRFQKASSRKLCAGPVNIVGLF